MSKEAKQALQIAIDYMNDRLEDHDCKYQRHPATEAERINILADIETVKEALVKQSGSVEQGEPVACDNCKKLEDGLEHLRIKSELWKRDAIVWKSAYDVEVGYHEQEQRSDSEQLGKPVAWMQEGQPELYVKDEKDEKRGYVIPLYTTPQPIGFAVMERPWIELTDEEVLQVRDDMTLDLRSHLDFYRACEAKRKAKNERLENNT